MITFVTDSLSGEPNILVPLAKGELRVCDLQSATIHVEPAPVGGWTHSALCAIAKQLADRCMEGADAYIAGEWVGGTEV